MYDSCMTQTILDVIELGMKNSFILPTMADFAYNFSNIMTDKHGKLISQAVFAVESMADRRSSLADAWLKKNTCRFRGHLIIWSSHPSFYSSQLYSKNLFQAGLLMISAAWMLSKQLLLRSAPPSDTTLKS